MASRNARTHVTLRMLACACETAISDPYSKTQELLSELSKLRTADAHVTLRMLDCTCEASILVPHTNLGVTYGNKFIFNDR